MGKISGPALRIALGALLAVTAYVEVVTLPTAVYWAIQDGWPLGEMIWQWTVVLLAIVSVQVILVCAWRVVTLARRGTVFSNATLRNLNIAIGAIGAWGVLLVAYTGRLMVSGGMFPELYVVHGVILAGIVALALIALLVRRLLTQAIARNAEAARMEAELDEVI